MMIPCKPCDLGPAGSALWDEITAVYDLEVEELHHLARAAREADLIDRLETELVDAPLMIDGARHVRVANPLLGELRQHRSVFKSLLRGINFAADQPSSSRRRPGARDSTAARKAALARWGGA